MTDDYYVAQLDRESHVRDLQSLYDRCPDFVELVFGQPTHATAAEEDLAFGRNMVYGIYSRDARLIGALEMLRDYPKPNEWWIGLRMLDPNARGHRLGASVCRTTFDWIAQEGARAVWIGVQEKNERAHNFWSRLGFLDVERQPYVASNGYETTVVLMKKSVVQTRMSGPHL